MAIAAMNGRRYLVHTLPASMSGKIGVWSKAGASFTSTIIVRYRRPQLKVEVVKTALNDAAQGSTLLMLDGG
jgi:hypothetical protein